MTFHDPLPFLLKDDLVFPEVDYALKDPNGLLAIGGDLSRERLMLAYKKGIFPWFSEPDPIIWWSPDPRAVLFLDELKVSKSLGKSIRNRNYEVWLNKDFNQLVLNCAKKRADAEGTWLTDDMQKAYIDLHHHGVAHCISVYYEKELVGGLYGLSQGRFFFGESMYSDSADASKVALYFLVEHLKTYDFLMIDCQVPNAHLKSLGSRNITRSKFIAQLNQYVEHPQPKAMWAQQYLNRDSSQIIRHL